MSILRGYQGRDTWHGGTTARSTPALPMASPEQADRNISAFRQGGRLLYEGAGYVCAACGDVFDVECVYCHRKVRTDHREGLLGLPAIVALRPMTTRRAKGKAWALVECACRERFSVMVR